MTITDTLSVLQFPATLGKSMEALLPFISRGMVNAEDGALYNETAILHPQQLTLFINQVFDKHLIPLKVKVSPLLVETPASYLYDAVMASLEVGRPLLLEELVRERGFCHSHMIVATGSRGKRPQSVRFSDPNMESPIWLTPSTINRFASEGLPYLGKSRIYPGRFRIAVSSC